MEDKNIITKKIEELFNCTDRYNQNQLSMRYDRKLDEIIVETAYGASYNLNVHLDDQLATIYDAVNQLYSLIREEGI